MTSKSEKLVDRVEVGEDALVAQVVREVESGSRPRSWSACCRRRRVEASSRKNLKPPYFSLLAGSIVTWMSGSKRACAWVASGAGWSAAGMVLSGWSSHRVVEDEGHLPVAVEDQPPFAVRAGEHRRHRGAGDDVGELAPSPVARSSEKMFSGRCGRR